MPADVPTPIAGPIHPLLRSTEEYPFVRLAKRRAALAPAGLPVIDFGMGDPRGETPEFIRRTLTAALPAVSSYPASVGKRELREACARWLGRRFGIQIDPERHVLPANGTKEAVFLMALAASDVAGGRDTVVIPTPAYPVYDSGARYAGCTPHGVPLRSEDGWRFEPSRVPDAVWRRAALLWINSPHNPTGAVTPSELGARIVSTARRHGFWVVSDEAYSDLWFEGGPPPTLLEHGLDNVVALFTLSKRSAMTGYRSGFMVGDERLIDALRRFRPNVGVATPDFIQDAAIAAWDDDAHTADQRRGYAEKRTRFQQLFAQRGWQTEASEATFYLWMRAPGGDDAAFVDRLLALGIVATPGSYLGAGGEGFVRWALVPTLEQCRAAIARIEEAGL